MRVGPYEVLEEIAKGGMGVVYRARDPRIGRDVALKLLLRADSEAHVQRLIREAESLARLRHPHIVRVHGVEEHEGCPVLVMEWVAGESLQDALDRAGPLEPDEALRLARSLAEALAYAHGQGVLHRDLKPANVLLDEGGAPRLTDFGLAQLLDDQGPRLSQTGAMMGSPEYFAPEQAFAKRDQVGPWTDVYGLGGTLYAALTGGPPFSGQSLAEYAIAAAKRTPDPPSAHAAGIDPELDAICLRCLAKEPGDRFESAADLADALEGIGSASVHRGVEVAILALGGLVFALGVVFALLVTLDPGSESSPPGETVAPTPDVAPVRSTPPTPGRGVEVASWLKRARGKHARGEFDAALQAVERALGHDPDSLKALGMRGLIQFKRGALAATRADADRLVALAPDSPKGYYLRGLLAWKDRRLREATDILDQALVRDPNHLPSLVHRATCWNERGRLDRAIADARRVVALYPRRVDLRVTLATLLMNNNAFKEARAEAERAVELEETHDAFYIRGTIRLAQGDREGAVRDLSKAISIDPKQPGPYQTRGLLRSMDGDVKGGLEDLNTAMRLAPQDKMVRAQRAQILQDLGRFADAEEDIRRLLAKSPKDQGGLMLWTRQALLQQQHAEALRRANVTLGHYPKWAKLYGKRAVARFHLGKLEGCIADCGRALASSGEFYLALRMRATAQARLGRYALAVADLRRLLAKLPSHKRRDRPSLERQLARYQRRAKGAPR